MKTLELIENACWYFRHYRFGGIYAIFFSVGWKQDSQFIHNGADLIVSKYQGYFTGTYFQKIKEFGDRFIRPL
jgi:hypothetical protein